MTTPPTPFYPLADLRDLIERRPDALYLEAAVLARLLSCSKAEAEEARCFLPFGYRKNGAGELEIVAEEAELVREIVAGVAEGSTLYGVAKRLNDLGLPSPGRRYPGGERKPGRSWSATTIHNIVHQRAYSGVHEVRIKETGETIERPGPAIVSEALQRRA